MLAGVASLFNLITQLLVKLLLSALLIDFEVINFGALLYYLNIVCCLFRLTPAEADKTYSVFSLIIEFLTLDYISGLEFFENILISIGLLRTTNILLEAFGVLDHNVFFANIWMVLIYLACCLNNS